MTAPVTILGYLPDEQPAVLVRVHGVPIPQGSIRSLGKGRPSIHSNAGLLLPWRAQVQTAFEVAIGPGPLLIDGPVAVEITFTVPKPKAAPKRRRTYPISRPDLDKLARAIGDAATAAGVWRDDSQVVELVTRKAFPSEHPDALPVPGATIAIYRLVDL